MRLLASRPVRRGFRVYLLCPFLLGSLLSIAWGATPRVHAIVGARIVIAPGQVIERGTVVMRDGVVVALGPNAAVPADARVWRGDSLTVYPGLIDAYVVMAEAEAGRTSGGAGGRDRARPETSAPVRGAAHELPGVRPEARVVEALPLGKSQLEGLRAAGFTAAQIAPRAGILRGQSAVVGLGDRGANDAVMRPDAAQVIALEAERDGYPGSLMGAISVVRQGLMDARWYRDVQALYARSPQGRERPEENVSWAALEPVVAGRQPALFVTSDMLELLRASAIAREAGVTAMAVGSGDEYKRAHDIAATAMPLIVPVNFPEPPAVADPVDALEATTEELRHWYHAPENPGRLMREGVPFALTAHGLKDVKKFRARVGTAIEKGLAADAALAAVTTVPARMLGLSDRLGTVAVGKIADLTVTRGDLFSDQGKVVEVWVDGDHYATAGEETLKGKWQLRWGSTSVSLVVEADKDTTVKVVVGADTLSATEVRYQGDRLSFQVRRGSDPVEAFALVLRDEVLIGTLRLVEHPEHGSHDVIGVRLPNDDKGAQGGKNAGKDKDKDEPIVTPAVMGNSEAWRMARPEQPAAVLVRNATLWTAGPQGIFQGDLLVRAGKIAAVGKGLTAPGGAQVIDATGKQVAPGIIDEHSHAAILGNVNECTHNVTCEVRIQDVVNSESRNIYYQLAGGTTIMHLLHGSCNPIGGQCAVIKNRWGAAPDELLFAAAPPTVKFALGENVKRSNFQIFSDPNRYPATRGGVEQVIRESFQRAQDYRAALAEWKSGKRKLPPRRDLQLEALQQIIEGKRLITCHSYRQDEMLMLMRLTEEFGFHVNTLTHMQEAYKVADEIAAHGASAMGFSDWWAYKFEVIDGIPYNGYLLWDRGVNVGFNSDDAELARRLNVEAAKAVKYGGVPPEEAIKFVTLNPARALKIDSHVGSLEPGKDADFSIWSGSPISPYSVCEQTWIDGRKYFDRAADLAGREALARERALLVAKARDAKKDGDGEGGGRASRPRYLEEADLSGNDCEGREAPFMSESERRARQSGGTQGVQR
jgi:imidazolonepropionase-like amidohydrolase